MQTIPASYGSPGDERLQIDADGSVQLQLKTEWSDGSTHLLFTPGEFIEKLTALIPPPKSHLVRWVYPPTRESFMLNLRCSELKPGMC